MAKKIRAIDGIEIKGSENTFSGISEPTVDGNNVRTKNGSTFTYSQTELVSTTEKNTWNGKQDFLGYTPVTNDRAITINGTTLDLTANRSWNVGDILSSNSYSDPSWITNLAWSKISSTPTTLSGYGITDAWKIGGNDLISETILGGINGNFGLDVRTNGLTAFKILASPLSAVNYLTFKSNITGNNATIGVLGDTNASISYNTNGSGNHVFNRTITVGGLTSLENSGGVLNVGGANTVRIGGNFQFQTPSNSIVGLDPVSTLSLAIAGRTTEGTIIGHGISITYNTGTTYSIQTIRHLGVKTFDSGSGSTAKLIALHINPTINQNAGATGSNIELLNFNPTLTSLAGNISCIKSNLNSGAGRLGLDFSGSIDHYLGGSTSIGTTTRSSLLTLGGSTTARSSLRLLAGTAPTTPNDGDIWYDGTNIYLRVGSTTKMFTTV